MLLTSNFIHGLLSNKKFSKARAINLYSTYLLFIYLGLPTDMRVTFNGF